MPRRLVVDAPSAGGEHWLRLVGHVLVGLVLLLITLPATGSGVVGVMTLGLGLGLSAFVLPWAGGFALLRQLWWLSCALLFLLPPALLIPIARPVRWMLFGAVPIWVLASIWWTLVLASLVHLWRRAGTL